MKSDCHTTLSVALCLCALAPALSAETYQEFIKRDRQELKDFVQGKTTTVARAAARQAAPGSDRERALNLYNRYCQLRGSLENPDPKKGYYARIAQMRAKLFPTGRPNVDPYSLWSDNDWDYNWPLLQELEARVPKIQAEMQTVEKEWSAAGFGGSIGPLGDFCYGRKSWVSWLDKEANEFPSPIRSNQVDYVGLRVDTLWPTNTPATTSTTATGGHTGGGPTNPVFETKPSVPEPPPVEAYEETTENVPKKKAWDQMTPDERHQALKANDPDAWINVYRALTSGKTNEIEAVKQALSATGSTAAVPVCCATNLTPTAVTPAKPWKDMTPEERYQALKRCDPAAWDAVRAALLSGDPKQVAEVIKALSAKAIPDFAIQTAYWHGYQVGLQEQATKPETSQLETIVAAYQHPVLQKAVRDGYADAKAGKPAVYSSPVPQIPASLEPSLDTPATDAAGSKPKPLRPERP